MIVEIVIALVCLLVGTISTRIYYKLKFKKIAKPHGHSVISELLLEYDKGFGDGESWGRNQERIAGRVRSEAL